MNIFATDNAQSLCHGHHGLVTVDQTLILTVLLHVVVTHEDDSEDVTILNVAKMQLVRFYQRLSQATLMATTNCIKTWIPISMLIAEQSVLQTINAMQSLMIGGQTTGTEFLKLFKKYLVLLKQTQCLKLLKHGTVKVFLPNMELMKPVLKLS